MTKKEINLKLSSIPALKRDKWVWWEDGKQIKIQAYVGTLRKPEFYGHQFVVNFDERTLTPVSMHSIFNYQEVKVK